MVGSKVGTKVGGWWLVLRLVVGTNIGTKVGG